MSSGLPSPTHRRCISAPPFELTPLRLSLPSISKSPYNSPIQRPKALNHRRAYSVNFTPSRILLPLIQPETHKTPSGPLPSLSELDLSPRSTTSTLSTSRSPTPQPKMEKRMVQVDPSVAAYLKKGGVIFVRSKDGRRMKLCLPRIAVI